MAALVLPVGRIDVKDWRNFSSEFRLHDVAVVMKVKKPLCSSGPRCLRKCSAQKISRRGAKSGTADYLVNALVSMNVIELDAETSSLVAPQLEKPLIQFTFGRGSSRLSFESSGRDLSLYQPISAKRFRASERKV